MTDPSHDGDGDRRPLRRVEGLSGRRQRRLKQTVLLLALAIAVATVAAALVYRATRPNVRKPGEALEEITEQLTRDLPAEAPQPLFTDVTEAAGLGGFVSFAGHRSSQLPEDMGAGAAWGDFDDDGDDDLFLVSAGGALTLPPEELAPSELYENLGDGTFRRRDDFPETRIIGMAAAWGDSDSDGDLDLVVSGYRSLLLFRNEGGSFVPDRRLQAPEGFWAGVSWGDFDNDRDLDLYVCGYVRYVEDAGDLRASSEQYGAAVPYTLNPASFQPERNLLFQNDGGTFTEVAAPWGASNPEGRSLTALWHDLNDDGRLDLYVANDISDNALFLNRGEDFDDAGLAAWVADYRGAMGLAAGDWNRDGDDDLFVTHWLAQENALYDSRLAQLRQARAAETRGGATPQVPLNFSDLAAKLGLGQIALQSVSWGTEFVDLDADGWLDLVVVNGSTLETESEPKLLRPQPGMLFWNQRGEYFHDLAPLAPTLARPQVSRGLALADFDGDGDQDLLIQRLGEGAQLLRNDMQKGHWLKLRLRSRSRATGPESPPRGFGDGASVTVRLGEVELRRSVGSSSYLSQSSRTLHFGLGEAEAVDQVRVRWLGGATQVFGRLQGDALWELLEGEPEPRRVSGKAADAGDDRERLVAFWAKQRAAMDAMKRDGDVEKAAGLFREALALDPDHEDSRYYLGNCLAALGRVDEALAQLEELRRRNPTSHRGHKQWGVLRAVTARSEADLEAAEAALERSHEINPEETGTLLVLGEISLLRGQDAAAEQRFQWACRTNPKAVSGFFLRAFLAWKAGDRAASEPLLQQAKEARGDGWKPAGAVAEGDVAARMHREITPLSKFWEAWDGSQDPDRAFAELDAFLRHR